MSASRLRRRPFGDYVARQRAAVAESARYSRFVGLMKVVLPLTAAAIALVVVAWPYLDGAREGIGLSFADVAVGPDQAVYMTNARYVGADRNDQPFNITADTVIQDAEDADTVHFTAPQGDILLRDGAWLTLSAQRGTLRRKHRRLELKGGVDLFSDAGYELHTERVEVDLDTNAAWGDEPVRGQGPLGELSADRFRLEQTGERLRFDGNVRLVVYPRAGA